MTDCSSVTYVGLDVSKGYVDFLCYRNQRRIGKLQRLDDTSVGHEFLQGELHSLCSDGMSLVIGLESTGGLERTWLRSLRRWIARRGLQNQVQTYLVDPRAVHSAAQMLPHRCKTDPSSAESIAVYLSTCHRRLTPYEESSQEGHRSFFHLVSGVDKDVAAMVNRIKSLLAQVHPGLVSSATRSGLSNWLVELLDRYPTAARLAKARASTLVQIPHITTKKARRLIAAAAQAPGTASGSMYEIQMRHLIDLYRTLHKQNEAAWAPLIAEVSDRADYKRLLTITGVGPKIAAAFVCEVGDVRKFHSGDALVAFFGLDPVFEQSGDGLKNKGISHRGSACFRGVLYNGARSAARHNPIVQPIYQRKVAAGRSADYAYTAVMAKMVRVMYACLISETDFDPNYQDKRHAQKPVAEAPARPPRAQTATDSTDTTAPVSRQERKRRQRAAAEQEQQERGHKRDQCPKTNAPVAQAQPAAPAPARKARQASPQRRRPQAAVGKGRAGKT